MAIPFERKKKEEDRAVEVDAIVTPPWMHLLEPDARRSPFERHQSSRRCHYATYPH